MRAIQGDPHNKVIQENLDYFLSKKYPDQPEMSSADVVRRHAAAEMLTPSALRRLVSKKCTPILRTRQSTPRADGLLMASEFFNEVLGRDKGKHQALLEAAAAIERELVLVLF